MQGSRQSPGNAMRAITTAGLSLLGFKPASCLKPWHTWRQSNFVYPDERTMPGSTTAFIALHEAMRSQERVAICTYVRSRNAEPRLVALMAAQELKDEYGEQVSCDCTHIPVCTVPCCPRTDLYSELPCIAATEGACTCDEHALTEG